MITTRKVVLDDFLSWTRERGDSVARDLAERLLNRAVLKIWLTRPWAQFRAAVPHTFTAVVGTRDYVMPRQFGRIALQDGRIRNSTRGYDLWPVDQGQVDRFDPAAGTALEQTGLPRSYVLDNTVGVTVQPSSAGEACEVVSDSTGDIAVRAYVEGTTDTGIETRRQVTLSGTSPVAVGSWSRIEHFGKSYPAGTDPSTELTSSEGEVTLRTVSGPTTLQVLQPDEASVDLLLLTLVPTPNAADSYVVPFMRAPRRLIDDADPLPRYWGNAVFEEMSIQWLVNDRKLTSDAQVPRPHLADLIYLENANRAGLMKNRRPFGGVQA